MKHHKRRTRRNPAIHKVKRRRRLKRNPTFKNFDITKVLMNGAIGGAGAFGALWISKKINTILDKYTGGTPIARNGIALAIAVAGSFAGYKYLDKEKAEALSAGMVTAIVLLIMKTNFGFDAFAGALDNPLDSYTLGYEYADGSIGLLNDTAHGSLGLLAGRMGEDSEIEGLNDYM